MSDFAVEMLPISDLRPHPRNARIHGERQLAVLERRFRALGWYKNAVVARHDRKLTILAGHGIIEGARRAGETVAPCHVRDLDPMSPEAVDILEGDNTVADLADDDLDLRLENLLLLQDDGRLENVGFDETALENLRAELQTAEFNSTLGAEPDVPPPEDDDGPDPDPSDTRATIGTYRFEIERETFLQWETEIRETVGFDNESIIAEIRRRLGL